MKWKKARSNGRTITGYTVRCSTDYMQPPSEADKVDLPIVLIDKEDVLSCKVAIPIQLNTQAQKLKSGRYYAFQLTAYNECGETSGMVYWFRTQASVPNQPSNFRCVGQTNHSISLEWDALSSEDWNGSEVDSYVVQMKKESGSQENQNAHWEIVNVGKSCEATISGLTANSTYSFRLCAHNSQGDSGFTYPVTFSTILGLSSPPIIRSQLSAKKHTTTSLYVSWESEEQFQNLIDKYRVIVESLIGSHCRRRLCRAFRCLR